MKDLEKLAIPALEEKRKWANTEEELLANIAEQSLAMGELYDDLEDETVKTLDRKNNKLKETLKLERRDVLVWKIIVAIGCGFIVYQDYSARSAQHEVVNGAFHQLIEIKRINHCINNVIVMPNKRDLGRELMSENLKECFSDPQFLNNNWLKSFQNSNAEEPDVNIKN